MTRKSLLIIAPIIFFIFSCLEEQVNNQSEVSEEIDFSETDNRSLIEVLDSTISEDPAGSIYFKIRNNELDSCFLPEKSQCGGAVTGYYENDSVVYIYSYYGAEFGYTKSNVFFVNGKVYRIDYEEHIADFVTYNKTYPEAEGIIEDNLTYIDNSLLFFYVKDTTHGLLEQYRPKLKLELLECGMEMKLQLEKVENCR
jgi:hypothetical protein